MGLFDRFSSLETRVAAMELRFNGCNCRTTGSTAYHSARDLAAIMAVSCPTHSFRDLGNLLWFPAALPLLPEDRQLCTCPPIATRTWLEDKRDCLTVAEQEAEFCMLDEEFANGALQKFAIDQAEVARLVQRYNIEKTTRRCRKPKGRGAEEASS